MKVLYNKKEKNITTWWNETGGGTSDAIMPEEAGFKVIHDLPDLDTPETLEYPLFYYVFDDRNKMVVDEERLNDNFNTHSQPKFVPTFFSTRADAINQIDIAAEQVRASFITSTSSQMLIYVMKESEAIKFIAAGYPEDTTDYVMLTTESLERKIVINELADTIVTKAAEWKVTAARIEGIRLKYKDLIMSLSSKTTEVDDILVITEEAIRVLKEI